MEWRENKSGGFNVKHIGMIFFFGILGTKYLDEVMHVSQNESLNL